MATEMHSEAQGYADRNRGNTEKWFDYTGEYNHPQPKERIITDEAKKNAQTNKGSMGDIMGGYSDPPIQHELHPQAVKSEASANADASKGASMKKIFDDYGNVTPTEKPGLKVIGSEAQEFAARNQGVVTNLMNNYANMSLESAASDRPVPKLDFGGDNIANEHVGEDMGPIMRMESPSESSPKETKFSKLHQESEGSWDEIPPARRTRPEAEDIIARRSEDSLNGIMHMDGDHLSNNSTRWQVKTLSHLETTKTPRAKMSPSRTRPEALDNYQRSRGSEMGAILKMEPSLNNSPRRVNRMFLKSEEW